VWCLTTDKQNTVKIYFKYGIIILSYITLKSKSNGCFRKKKNKEIPHTLMLYLELVMSQ